METSPRVPPLSPEQFTDVHKGLVGDWSNLNFSRVLVRHPELYKAFVPFIDKVIRGSNLPPRDREVVVLRVLALCDEIYEMHHHVLIARNAGMSDAEIDMAKAGDAGLSAFDKALAQAVEELVRHQAIGDATWRTLAERYSQAQLMEVVGLVGCYTTMAMLTKSFGIEVEQESEAFNRLAKLRQYT